MRVDVNIKTTDAATGPGAESGANAETSTDALREHPGRAVKRGLPGRVRSPREVTLTRFELGGSCTGHDDTGREWQVRGGIPGTTVLAAGKAKSASVLRVLAPRADAVVARCAQFGTCGGCTLQTMPVAAQRSAKLSALERLLEPLGPSGRRLREATGGEYSYRNKLELSFGGTRYLTREALDEANGADIPDRHGRFLGMHGPGQFDRIVDTPRCEIADEAINIVLAKVRADTLASPFPLWKPREGTGFWRHIVLRAGAGGTTLVLVYTTPGAQEERDWLRAHAPAWGATAVCWYTSERTSDAAVGELTEVLHGTPRLHVELGDVRLNLAPTAFFQVNDEGAAVLLATVAEAVGEGETLLDLYCGVGAFGLALRHRFRRVGGIELHGEAIQAARTNAQALGVVSAYRAGAVEYELPALFADLGMISRLGRGGAGRSGGHLAVLVDPPRSGLHPKALAAVANMQADTLVYVACKPASLARDAVALLAAGWVCSDWWAVDLFPQTPHVEVVARFHRAAKPAE